MKRNPFEYPPAKVETYFKVPAAIANQPAPKKPEPWQPFWKWEQYFEDMACWMAMKADVLRYGITEE